MVWIWFWLARVVHGTSVGCGVFFFLQIASLAGSSFSGALISASSIFEGRVQLWVHMSG